MKKESPSEDMSTLVSCMNNATRKGFKADFRVTENGLESSSNDKVFQPTDVCIENFYRFEGESDPADSTILYLIKTNSGLKGVLLDAYGAYADDNVSAFIQNVECIVKKEPTKLRKSKARLRRKKIAAVAIAASIIGGTFYYLIRSSKKKKMKFAC